MSELATAVTELAASYDTKLAEANQYIAELKQRLAQIADLAHIAEPEPDEQPAG